MALRLIAYFFSVIFHPLLMVTYMLLISLFVNPYSFGTNSVTGGLRHILLIFSSTFFLPVVCVLLMKALKLIPSLELEKAEDRIGPFIVTGILYLFTFYFIYKTPGDIPLSFKACFLGAVIGLFIAFFLNLFSKISLHAVGVGGLLGMVLITIFHSNVSPPFFLNLDFLGTFKISFFNILFIVILICGIVGTSRLILGAHEPRDLYGGFLVGLSTQFIALSILT